MFPPPPTPIFCPSFLRGALVTLALGVLGGAQPAPLPITKPTKKPTKDRSQGLVCHMGGASGLAASGAGPSLA